jgi:hypothetical protein
MIIVWLILFGIIAIGIGMVVINGIIERRQDEKIADTADWLETEATIQDGTIERIDKYTSFPCFAFSYVVNGEYLSGRFYLKSDLEYAAVLIQKLLKQRFPVQYDPNDPSAWFIAEESIENCEILQNLSPDCPLENRIYRDDGDAPQGLHLEQ